MGHSDISKDEIAYALLTAVATTWRGIDREDGFFGTGNLASQMCDFTLRRKGTIMISQSFASVRGCLPGQKNDAVTPKAKEPDS